MAEFVEPEEVKMRVDGFVEKPAATPVTTPRGSGSSAMPAAAPMGLMALSVPTPTSALPPPPPLPPPPRERPNMSSKKGEASMIDEFWSNFIRFLYFLC